MGRKRGKNSRVLIISDTHYPYQHPDTYDFLKKIKEEYDPDKVVHIGDEIDGHSISFHNTDPDLLSPSQEFEKAIDELRDLYKMFPNVDLVESNHGSLVYRKAKAHGLPASVIKPYREMLDAPKGWNWHKELVLVLSDGRPCLFHHGKTSSPMKLSKNMSMSSVQGHYHSKFQINYWANPIDLYFDMYVGCLIDDKSLAFAYNKTTIDRPLIGCAMIIKGQPVLLPMVLDGSGNWIGKLV